MKRRNNKSKLVALFLGIVLMGIGYAYLTTNLKIKGTTNIGNTRWNVHFENPGYNSVYSTVTFPSNSNSNVDPGVPVIKGEDRQQLEWTAIFNNPGDEYDFYADVVNDSDIAADIDYDNSFFEIKIGDNELLNVPLKNLLDWFYTDNVDDGYGYWSDDRPEGLPEYISFNVYYRGLSLEPGENAFFSCDFEIDEDKISTEEWQNLQGKEIKVKTNLKYKQSDGTVTYNNVKVRVEKPVINQTGTNISVVPSIINGTRFRYDFHKIEYDVVFNNPGDFYEFTVDLKNYSEEAGYAYLEDRTITIGDGEEIDFYDINNLPEGLVYDRGDFQNFFKLCENTTRKVTVRIGLDPNISTERLNELKGKHIKVYTRLETDEGRDSAYIGRCGS